MGGTSCHTEGKKNHLMSKHGAGDDLLIEITPLIAQIDNTTHIFNPCNCSGLLYILSKCLVF